MSKKRVLSPIEAERVNTIKTNARRLNMPMENIANDLGYTDSHIFGVFTGRYTSERTEVILSEMENYLVKKLGVRYVQPYFLDLKEGEIEMSLEQEVIELRKEVKRLRNSNVMLNKSLTDKRPSAHLFKDVKLNGEVRKLNNKYGYKNNAIADFILFPDNEFPDYDWRLWGNKDTIYSSTLEEYFRALALSIFGTKRNQALMTLADQEEAIDAYEQFKKVWIQFYETRLERITD